MCESLEVGTSTVVGYGGGWMALLETAWGRLFFRVVYPCHRADLSCPTLFSALDGGTKSKDSFEGPVGEKLSSAVRELPLVTSVPLPPPSCRRCQLRYRPS